MTFRTDALGVVLAGWVLTFASSPALAQEAKAEKAAFASEIRDGAKLFSVEAVTKAKTELCQLESLTKVATVIETVPSLGEESIQTVVTRNATKWGKEGIYILIDKRDHKIDLVVTRGLPVAIERAHQLQIRESFIPAFKSREFDIGLERGVAATAKVLMDATTPAKVAQTNATPKPATPLVERNHVRLSLGGARLIVTGAEAKAVEMGLKVNIAVVDDGGHLLSFDRMDGARPASGYTALTKATASATFRQETGPMPKGAPAADVHLSLSLQNAASASGGKLTTLYGGVPVVVDGQVIGAVGVGGGSGEQDAEIAKAGITRLMAELNPPSTAESPKSDAASKPRLER